MVYTDEYRADIAGTFGLIGHVKPQAKTPSQTVPWWNGFDCSIRVFRQVSEKNAAMLYESITL